MQPLQTFTGLALKPPAGLNFGQAFKDASLKMGQLGALVAQAAFLSKQMVVSLPQPPPAYIGALMGAVNPMPAALEILKASCLPIGDFGGLTMLAQLRSPTNFYGTFIAPPFTNNQSATTHNTNQ